MRRDQKGFSAVEGLLILIIIGLIGFVGWYVYHTRNNTNSIYNNAASSTSSTPKTTVSSNGKHTYKGEGYTLEYPSDWKFVAKTDTYPTDEFLPKANYPNNNAYILIMEHDKSSQSAKTYGDSVYSNKQQLASSSTDSTPINGYDTYTVNFKTTFGASGHDIFIIHKGVVVEFVYYDDGDSYVTNYKSIINSIKFTN